MNELNSDKELADQVNTILRRIRHERSEWDGGMAELKVFLTGPHKGPARDIIEQAARRERLEFQWKLEELLDETAPPGTAKKSDEANKDPEPEPELLGAPAPVGPIRPDELVPIYDDPRGIMIHRHKPDGRWILTQINPMNGQPQSMELAEDQKAQVKQELQGSPYWVEEQP